MKTYQNTEEKFYKHNCNICGKQILTKKKFKQAGAELGQAQLKLGLGFTSTNLH